MNIKNDEIRKKRRSAIIGSIILFIVGTLHLWKGNVRLCIILYLLSATIFILSIFFTRIFIKITNAISECITGFLLSVVFYLFITPVALIMKLFRKDPLDKKIDKQRNSYWEKKEAPAVEDVSRYEKQF